MSLILATMSHIIKFRKYLKEMNSPLPTMHNIKFSAVYVSPV